MWIALHRVLRIMEKYHSATGRLVTYSTLPLITSTSSVRSVLKEIMSAMLYSEPPQNHSPSVCGLKLSFQVTQDTER